MTGPVVALEGGRRLRKQLTAAGVDLGDLRATHLDVARVVASTAKPTTPKRTGRLAASVRPGASRTQAVIRAGKANVPYANPIHYGWPRRHIAAQPWLSQAAQRTEPRWLPIYMTEVDWIIAQCAGGPT